MKRDDALLFLLIDLLEPRQGAWDDFTLADAHYCLPREGDMQQRFERLRPPPHRARQ